MMKLVQRWGTWLKCLYAADTSTTTCSQMPLVLNIWLNRKNQCAASPSTNLNSQTSWYKYHLHTFQLCLHYERVVVKFPLGRHLQMFRKVVRLLISQLNILYLINSKCGEEYIEVNTLEDYLLAEHEPSTFNKNMYKRRYYVKGESCLLSYSECCHSFHCCHWSGNM